MRAPAAAPEWTLRRPRVVGLALRGVGRRPGLFLLVAAAVLGAAAALLAVLPPTYEVRVKLVVRNPPAVATRLDHRIDAPFRTAARLLYAERELRGLARDADLAARWRERRAPLLRLKDRLLPRRLSAEELEEVLAEVIHDRLETVFHRDGVVELVVRWGDPESAAALSDAALRAYLRIWQGLEVSSIATVVAILERRADAGRGEVERRLGGTRGAPGRGALEAERDLAASEPGPSGAAGSPRARGPEGRGGDAREGRGEGPPRVVRATPDPDTRVRMRALRLALPLGDARDDDDQAAGAGGDGGLDDDPEAPRMPGLGELDRRAGARLLESARSGLAGAEFSYAGVVERLEAARVDLDTARAAFEERYLVVVPPVPPRDPVKPSPPGILLSAAVDALLLALLASALVELRAERLAAAAAAATTTLEEVP